MEGNLCSGEKDWRKDDWLDDCNPPSAHPDLSSRTALQAFDYLLTPASLHRRKEQVRSERGTPRYAPPPPSAHA